MPKKPKPHELRNSNFRKSHGIERSLKPRPIFPERHLFVSEGSKTEPKYIDGIITKICEKLGEQARNQFKTIGDGSCTLTLLERAERYQKNDSDGFQHVWVIFDKDDFPPDAFDNTIRRCEALNERNSKRGIDLLFHAIWSQRKKLRLRRPISRQNISVGLADISMILRRAIRTVALRRALPLKHCRMTGAARYAV